MNVAAHITPESLRSGEPEALAALCDRRGAAVFAYCQRAAGGEAAAGAAAEAFAQFRSVIQPRGALANQAAAEVLLRSATRRCALVYADEAASAREGEAGAEGCDVQGAALIVYVEGALAAADREVVADHVAECGSCAATLQRLQEAEAAFSVKPGTQLPVDVAREILTALVQAAPVSAHGGDESAVRDEALRLLTGDKAPPSSSAPPVPAPASSQPVQRAIAAYEPGRLARLRERLPRLGPQRFGPGLPGMLLRGTIRFAALVLAAAAIGILLGVALSKL